MKYSHDTLNNMKNERITPLFYLGFLASFTLLTFDLFQPALPAMTSDFGVTQTVGQLTLSLYLLSYGVSQLFWGPIIEHYGRRLSLYISLGIFLSATLFCIFAPNIWVLILGRIFQGFSVCCANNLAFSSTRDIEDNTLRARTISYISMIISVSPIFAPIVGSYIFIYSNWQMIFWTMFGIAILVGGMGKIFLRESSHWLPNKGKPSFSQSWLNYHYLLTRRAIWRALIITSASFSLLMIFIINASFMIIDDMGYTPNAFAYIFSAIGFNIILGNYIGIKLRERKSINWNIRLGTVLMLIGSALVFLLFNSIGMQLGAIAPVLIINMGIAMTNPPALSMALSDHPTLSSSSTALINTIRTVFSSILAGLISAFYLAHPNVFPIALFGCSIMAFMAAVLLYPLYEIESNAPSHRSG